MSNTLRRIPGLAAVTAGAVLVACGGVAPSDTEFVEACLKEGQGDRAYLTSPAPSVSPEGAEPPENSSRPSGSVTVLAFATFFPDLAR